jgi:CBS domain containing-hemolysin-like protein
MQSRHIHLAIVVDEYRGTDGLCSIEDWSRKSSATSPMNMIPSKPSLSARAGEGSFVADARTGIDELEEILGVDLLPAKREERAELWGGWLSRCSGGCRSAASGSHHDSGLEFEILEADPRRVKRVLIPHQGPAENASR